MREPNEISAIERIGGHAVLTNETEINAAFAARDALEPLDRDAKFRVMTWVVESHDLIPPITLSGFEPSP